MGWVTAITDARGNQTQFAYDTLGNLTSTSNAVYVGSTQVTDAAGAVTEPRSIRFVAGLLDELLPHFSSRQGNVGCDETLDVGQGRPATWWRFCGATRRITPSPPAAPASPAPASPFTFAPAPPPGTA